MLVYIGNTGGIVEGLVVYNRDYEHTGGGGGGGGVGGHSRCEGIRYLHNRD